MINNKTFLKQNTIGTSPANIRKNRATSYWFRYRGTNSVGQPYQQ